MHDIFNYTCFHMTEQYVKFQVKQGDWAKKKKVQKDRL